MKNKSILYLSILTLVVAVTWATVSAIGHLRKPIVPTDVEKAAQPLDPNLDVELFTKLQNRANNK